MYKHVHCVYSYMYMYVCIVPCRFTCIHLETLQQLRHMFRRSTPNLFGDEDDDANSTGLCNRVVGITRINETNDEILEYCAMMCIRKTQHLENETNSGNFTALKAVYWPSWKNMEEKSRNKSLDVFHCNISSFNFM